MGLVRAGHFHPGSNQDRTSINMTRMDVLQMSSSGCLGSLAIVLTGWGRSLKRLATVSVGCSQYWMLFDVDVVPSLAQMSQYACDIHHGATYAVRCEQVQVPKDASKPRIMAPIPMLAATSGALVLIGSSPCLPRGVQP